MVMRESRSSASALERRKPCPLSILDALHKQLGVVPNMFRLIAQNSAALQDYTANDGVLTVTLDVNMRERIALAVAQVNGCGYCLSGA
jgi:alkylhydroperoxidase family enzyme